MHIRRSFCALPAAALPLWAPMWHMAGWTSNMCEQEDQRQVLPTDAMQARTSMQCGTFCHCM